MRKLDDYVKRTYRYYYEDGFVESAVGLLMIAVGTALFSWQRVAPSTIRTAILAVFLPALIIGGAVLVRRSVLKAKERVTYLRTGYVSYRQGEPAGSRWFLILPTVVLFVIVFILPETFSRMQFAVGYFSAVFLCYLGYRLEMRRFYAIGVAAFLIGIAATIMLSNETEGTGLTIAGTGLLLLLSGALTFLRYLRDHPKPRNEQQ